ncbi:MAG: penicillin-binding protein 2 [Nevskiales bacterium]|nr:penicillin-binding protein 2 [Nevskiales bacterium]
MSIGPQDAIKNLHAERQDFLTRVLIAVTVGSGLVLVLLTRLLHLQVLEQDYYDTRSNENRLQLTVIPPVRGLIYDRQGALLAQNVPTFVLELVPEQVPDLDDTLARLGRLVTLSENDLLRFRDRLKKTPPYRGVPLRSNLSLEEVARYQINRYDFPGVDSVAGLTRNYALGASAAHVVGYIGGITEDDLNTLDEKAYRGTRYVGRTGVEKSHEHTLHGTPSTKIVETNAAGRPLREIDYRRGTQGVNLFLSIDARLQLAAEQAFGTRTGALVAIEPWSGEILALVSKPGFDPHLFVEGIDVELYKALNEDAQHPLFNRALQGQYSPGSTLKPLMALAGLDHGVTVPGKREFCSGKFTLPNSTRQYRCWKRRGHGRVDLDDAITQSCDIYFYQTALSLGIDAIHDFLDVFGLGRPTGIDLPGENSGLLPSRDWKLRTQREAWFPGETLNLGIGQGYLTVTPLQLAQMAARIATRGQGYRPHLVHATQDPVTGTVTPVLPEPLPPIVLRDESLWQPVIEAMQNAVHAPSGTAYRIGANAPYRIAGKTGTVQLVTLAQDEETAPELQEIPRHLRDHALFIAFAPADNPRIALAVLSEHSGHGGSEAAPIARQVMDTWLLNPETPSK